MKHGKPLRSLKSKALQLLAQREQSRLELRRKLMAHALAEDASEARAAPGGSGDAAGGEALVGTRLPGADSPEAVGERDETVSTAKPVARTAPTKEGSATPAGRVDEVLAWLDAHRFQSDERFAESRINARAGRYGDLRIRQELKQHGVALDADAARVLGETEFSRAWAVWERRFGGTSSGVPSPASDAARQSRFLATRGFSPDAVRQVLRRARAKRAEAGLPSVEE